MDYIISKCIEKTNRIRTKINQKLLRVVPQNHRLGVQLHSDYLNFLTNSIVPIITNK